MSSPHYARTPLSDSRQNQNKLNSSKTSIREQSVLLPAMVKCKWCTAEVPDEHLAAHLELCSLLPIQCALRDTELVNQECTAELRGRDMFHEHRARCSFQPAPCSNAPRCKAVVSKRSLKIHLETCPFQLIHCPSCNARYYRSDQDYHSATCTEAQISCPLNCGIVVKRSELSLHFQETLMDHSYTNMQSEVYLPPDHPTMVYAILLKQLKELMMQIEISKDLEDEEEREHHSYTAVPSSPQHHPTALFPVRSQSPARIHEAPHSPLLRHLSSPEKPHSPLHRRPISPTERPQSPSWASAMHSSSPVHHPETRTVHDQPRIRGSHVNSQLPPNYLHRFDDCISRLDRLYDGVSEALLTIKNAPFNASADVKSEMVQTRSVFEDERTLIAREIDQVLHDADGLRTYVDPTGRKPPATALAELDQQRKELTLATKSLDNVFLDLKSELRNRHWAEY